MVLNTPTRDYERTDQSLEQRDDSIVTSPFLQSAFEGIIQVAILVESDDGWVSSSEEGRRRFLAISQALTLEPVESCMRHPAQDSVDAWVAQGVDPELPSMIFEAGERPDLIASWLHVLGHAKGLGLAMKRTLLRKGLASPSVLVRDAAIGAVEQWEDAELVEVLRTHRDSVPWLADYTRDVIRDLQG